MMQDKINIKAGIIGEEIFPNELLVVDIFVVLDPVDECWWKDDLLTVGDLDYVGA